ncbi:E3 ubiquitin-protein ligase Midline-1-like [Pecten maximus]|uniref:E3 ubiquitin-protein ligase Midline-1-like n=1 Tax=Pecten maximus TaxID=6579 RepID=UPI0014581E3A|nr:E3 ubiquitin-protein ligase Midline-1-like [Pecten maximus]XP_033725977.1 E3 ubiquitin-protein ligase Midline-1-like [Pecten maximus]
MAEGMIEELKRVLKCPICSNVLDDARVLKCGHTFCYLCIKQDYESHQLNKGNCPVCGENYFLKERDTRHLSKAFIVNNVLDIVKVPTVCKCAFCQTDDSTHICLKCKLNVCRYCSKRSMSFCTHQTVTMEYLNSDPFLQAIIQCSKSKPMCPSHREEEVNNFCQNCKRVICEECINEAHRHHTVLGLQEAVNQIRGGTFCSC